MTAMLGSETPARIPILATLQVRKCRGDCQRFPDEAETASRPTAMAVVGECRRHRRLAKRRTIRRSPP